MKLLSLIAGAVVLSGCAVSMHHPSKPLAERQLDHQQCKAESKDPFKVEDCLLAKGYIGLMDGSSSDR